MQIGARLKELRSQKNLSQGDIEKRTGLLRCYVSRVEHGHTIPSVGTLEKMARALEVPLYKLFYDGDEKPKAPKLHSTQKAEWGASKRDAETLQQFRMYMGKSSERDRVLLIAMAAQLAPKPWRRKSGVRRADAAIR